MSAVTQTSPQPLGAAVRGHPALTPATQGRDHEPAGRAEGWAAAKQDRMVGMRIVARASEGQRAPHVRRMAHDARRLPARVPVVRLLVACGGISSVLYVVAIDVLAALRHSRYHNYTSQMVSELFAVGAPTRNLLIWVSIPYNLLVFAFATGVWASSGSRRSARLAAVALAGYGTVSTAGLLLFPMDIRGTMDSRRDRRHIAATFVMSIFIAAAMGFGAFVRGVRFRLYTFATIVTVVVFGVLSGFLARPMPAPTPGLGLAERVNIYATMLWMGMLSIVLLRRQGSGAQDKQQSEQ